MIRLFTVLCVISLGACQDDTGFEPDQIDSGGVSPFLDAGSIDPAALAQGKIPVDRDARVDLPDVLPLGDDGACRTGRLVGTVCAPSGRIISAARVVATTRTCRGDEKVVETATNFRGYFELDELYPGVTTVTITSGRFIGRYTATVIAGAETAVAPDGNPKVCLPADSGRLAVLTGDFDKIGTVIDSLGFDYDTFCGSWEFHRPALSLLANMERLSQYDIVFINCANGINLRASNPEIETIKNNIRTFVRQGGSLYISDLASDFVSQLWPDFVRFDAGGGREGELDVCCICTDCDPECVLATPDEPKGTCPDPNDAPMMCRQPAGATGKGMGGDLQASIISPFLQQFVESRELKVKFEVGGWVEIESVSDEVEVLVNGPDSPLMVLFNPYPSGGGVVFTSFHNHNQATEAMLDILRALVFRL